MVCGSTEVNQTFTISNRISPSVRCLSFFNLTQSPRQNPNPYSTCVMKINGTARIAIRHFCPGAMEDGINRQWVLRERPTGMVEPSNFEFVEAELPAPADGQFLVRNLYLSLDPAMRTWMTAARTPL